MLQELAELQCEVRTPVCLDESLETVDDVRRAIDLGSLKIANIKIQRVGGFGDALAIYEICREHGIPVWVGTMPELGIGQAQGMALATLRHCLYPTDVEASLRWFRDDIIEPFLEVEDGCMQPRRRFGFEVSETKLKIRGCAETSELRHELTRRTFFPHSLPAWRAAKERLIIDTHLEVWTLDPKFPFAPSGAAEP